MWLQIPPLTAANGSIAPVADVVNPQRMPGVEGLMSDGGLHDPESDQINFSPLIYRYLSCCLHSAAPCYGSMFAYLSRSEPQQDL
jgi:hypothetical protein